MSEPNLSYEQQQERDREEIKAAKGHGESDKACILRLSRLVTRLKTELLKYSEDRSNQAWEETRRQQERSGGTM